LLNEQVSNAADRRVARGHQPCDHRLRPRPTSIDQDPNGWRTRKTAELAGGISFTRVSGRSLAMA